MENWHLSKHKFSIVEGEGTHPRVIARAPCNKSDKEAFGEWLKTAKAICDKFNQDDQGSVTFTNEEFCKLMEISGVLEKLDSVDTQESSAVISEVRTLLIKKAMF